MLKLSKNLELPDEAVTQTFAILEDRNTNLFHRFCRNIKITGDCWRWQGYKKNGYGSISVNNYDVYAHRLAFEAINGEIGSGTSVLHKCDNPACVNPKHLFAGSQLDNIADMRAKGKASNPPTHAGESHPKATLTDMQIHNIRQLSNQTQRKLAKMFGVSQSTIWRIRHSRTRSMLRGNGLIETDNGNIKASDNLFT